MMQSVMLNCQASAGKRGYHRPRELKPDDQRSIPADVIFNPSDGGRNPVVRSFLRILDEIQVGIIRDRERSTGSDVITSTMDGGVESDVRCYVIDVDDVTRDSTHSTRVITVHQPNKHLVICGVQLQRSAMTRWICGFYALIITVLGLVFPVSTVLTHAVWEQSYYIEVYQLYLFSVSVVFLAYLHLYVLRRRRRDSPYDSDDEMDGEFIGNKTSEKINNSHELENLGSREERSRTSSVSQNDEEVTYPVTFEAEGVNFYLRLGAIVFSIGSMVHDGFKVAQQFELTEGQSHCRAPLYVIVACVRMLFVFLQTFYLFKSHRVVINMHKALVRFGFMHLIGTNLCIWIITLVQETAEDFSEMQQDNQLQDSHTTTDAPDLHTDNDTHFARSAVSHVTEGCEIHNTLAWKASPYLFPCTIEYSLVAAGIIYRMYGNIGRSGCPETEHNDTVRNPYATECHKANKGLFAGLFVFVLTIISVSTFFIFDSRSATGEAGDQATIIFFVTEIILLGVATGLVIVNFVKFQQLRFIIDSVTDQLDIILLVVSYFGVCLFNGFLVVSTSANIRDHGTIGVLSLFTGFLAFIQSSLQTIFILDGLRRCAGTRSQVRLKPGRAIVTFLLLCNLSMWIVNTFEVKKAESLAIHNEHYGLLAWSIISHLTLPLVIFFRFHSTVCLSDIWINAYKLKGKKQ